VVELPDDVEALNVVELPDVVELVDDVVAPGSFFGGFPCADAPVTTTATRDAMRASETTSFRKTISSPLDGKARSVDP